MPRTGSCRCGALEISLAGPPLMSVACHCKGCQKMTGSAFSMSEMHPEPAFSVTKGEPVLGGLKGETQHNFCPECLTWVFSRPARLDGLVMVRGSMMDDADRFPPFAETWTAEKFAWVQTGAEHSFEAFPPEEAMPEVLQAYAALHADHA